ncbi:hypothetical protein W97_08293 [Coniosporium apollinis CBS 100218]|uniref:Domain of unknown function at the cortex 1 domain-containing protein n=1 Tax=Coniosporium apollinis (strain CBS 100218) TaxID=1168221 RepID=R7Z4N1_CONA1|nr:uncharacterized protein W97_08293 [Coniosporium apollinis CBS 100218]EON69107.1 hypothetical protein W97_08293 [Coniosporium apollinis CBS 100218]
MASKIKEKTVNKAAHRTSHAADTSAPSIRRPSTPSASNGPSGSTRPAPAPKSNSGSRYRLRVTAGPSYDPSTHKVVQVNSQSAVRIFNRSMIAEVRVRIRDYTGLPASSPKNSPYFDDPLHQKDRWSISFSFVPKTDLNGGDVVWGPDFDHPVRDRLPPGFNTAVRIVKNFIDPGIESDAYADRPWMYSPALSAWDAFRIGEKVGGGGEVKMPQGKDHKVLHDGADGDGILVAERYGVPGDSKHRKKFFLANSNRDLFVLEKGRLYHGDFFNPYIDFNEFALKLPGFSISVLDYIDDKTHVLRFVCKNRNSGDVYFVVVFTLLFGQ